MPLMDQQQSYTLLSLNESDGQTIITFQRTIQSCDDQDVHITVTHSEIIINFISSKEKFKKEEETSIRRYIQSFISC